MKQTLPVALGMLVGLYAVVAYFVPDHWLQATVSSHVFEWGGIVAAAAYVLGGINLVQVTWPKIRRREQDYRYKVVMLAAAAIMLVVGLPWRSVFGTESPGQIAKVGTDPAAAARGVAVFELASPPEVQITLGVLVTHAGRTPRVELPPGIVPVKAGRRVVGYDSLEDTITVVAGDVIRVTADPQMQWGGDGRVRTWLFDYVFAPCNATMFALLAFFVASAAFRAFRARNIEAGLLLGAAIIVLLARAPIGALISNWLPDLAQWILDVPSNGSRRAIIMGAAVGAIATSLRVILGLERSHLGGEQ
ncbi:MAG: hypothetical protein H0X17_03500 [Deltaproteobacteria bacterium]|nr:hypothetical protein [Deltaproteobacteria bacterium]